MKIQQVKIFKSVDTEITELERQINRWIRKNGVNVISMTGNLAGAPAAAGGAPMSSFAAGDIMIVLMYELDRPDA